MKLIELLKINKLYKLLLLFFFSCSQQHPVLKEEGREPFATLRFSDFHRIQYKGIGIKKWELDAKEAYIYNDQKTNETLKIILYDLNFHQILPSETTIVSKKAYVDYKENKMYIVGESSYKDKEILVKGSELSYDLEKEILSSDKEVTIIKKGNTIQCLKGLYYSKKEEIEICKKPSGQILQRKYKENNENKNFFF